MQTGHLHWGRCTGLDGGGVCTALVVRLGVRLGVRSVGSRRSRFPGSRRARQASSMKRDLPPLPAAVSIAASSSSGTRRLIAAMPVYIQRDADTPRRIHN